MAAMAAGLYRLLKARIFVPHDPNTSLDAKTVLITGGSSGLGLEAAIKYAKLGVRKIIIGCRNPERGSKAKSTVELLSNRADIVEIWPLDMSNYDSVISFAKRVDEEISCLDIALLNAGLLHRKYTLSPEGWEDTLQVNTLSTLLLALLLLPKLQEDRMGRGPANLTFTSSSTFKFVQREQLLNSQDDSVLQHVNKESDFTRAQYRISKLLVEFASKEISLITRQENGALDVIVNTACPGFCLTELQREYTTSPISRFFSALFYFIFARSAEQGSRTLVSATLLGAESHGRCWTNDAFADLSRCLVATEEGQELQKQSWKEILEELRTKVATAESAVGSAVWKQLLVGGEILSRS